MTEELRKKHKKWIKGFLTPILIKNPKFIACKNENVEIKSIEIKEMSLEVAFMLTICYFVKITLKIKADHSENRIQDEEKTFNVVVKVISKTILMGFTIFDSVLSSFNFLLFFLGFN